MKGRNSVGSFRAGSSFKGGASVYWNGVCAGDFILCSSFGFLEGFCKAISHVSTFVLMVWWKCSGSYLVFCVFGKDQVILEAKRMQTSLTLIPIFAVLYLAGDRGGISYCPLPVSRKQSQS